MCTLLINVCYCIINQVSLVWCPMLQSWMDYNVQCLRILTGTTRKANVRTVSCVWFVLRRGMAAVREVRAQGMCLGWNLLYHSTTLAALYCTMSPTWHLVQLKLMCRVRIMKCGEKAVSIWGITSTSN